MPAPILCAMNARRLPWDLRPKGCRSARTQSAPPGNPFELPSFAVREVASRINLKFTPRSVRSSPTPTDFWRFYGGVPLSCHLNSWWHAQQRDCWSRMLPALVHAHARKPRAAIRPWAPYPDAPVKKMEKEIYWIGLRFAERVRLDLRSITWVGWRDMTNGGLNHD